MIFRLVSSICMLVLCIVKADLASAAKNEESEATFVTADIWSVRSHEQKYTNLTRVYTTNESIIAYEDPEISVWDVVGEDFHRRGRRLLKDLNFCKPFRNSHLIVYNTNADNSTMVIYDLSSCKHLFNRTLADAIYDITVTTDKILVNFRNRSDEVYSWNGTHLQLVMPIASTYFARMSQNGQIAYRKSEGRQEATFYDLTSHKLKRVAVGFDFTFVLQSEDGRFAVFQEKNDTNFMVIEPATRKQIFYGTSKRLGQLRSVLADNNRLFFVFFASGQDTLDLVLSIAYIDVKDVNEELADKDLVVTHLGLTDYAIFVYQIVLRHIDGISYLQVISDKGVLSLFKLNEKEKSWVLLE